MSAAPPDDRFVAAVEAIYNAAPEPPLWPQALQAVADVFDDVGANIIWKHDDGSFGNIVSPNLQSALKDYEQGEWWRHDIRAIRSHEYGYRSIGAAITDRQFMTPEEIEHHPIYATFLARWGLRWTAGTHVSPDPRISVALSVQRAIGREQFSDDELKILGRLGRHVEKSLRLSIRLLDAELGNVGLGEALARLGIGVFALDSLKRVVFSNPAGQRLAGNGLSVMNRRLVAEFSSDNATLDRVLDRTINATAADLVREPKPILIQSHASERPLAIYVLPLAGSRKVAEEFLTHTRAIALVINSNRDEPADPAVVRDVLGLTLGEARVAALVGAGLPPRDAAEKLGITENTVRTILKRVFGKVGISRQSELATLLTKLVLR